MPTWSQGLKQFLTANNGKPLVGGKLYTYAAGTNTPKTAFKDALFATPHTNPIVLDSRGEELVYWSGLYKVVATYPSGRKLWTCDNVNGTGLVLSTPDAVELPPIANFTFAPASPVAPATVTGTNASTRLNGTESYLWTVDGIPVETTANASLSLFTSGAHAVSMRVSNQYGEDTKTQTINVTPGVPPPDITDITFTPSSGLATATPIVFAAVNAGGPISTYSWVYKTNGAFAGSGTLQSPIFTFSDPGEGSVELTATGPGGFDFYSEIIGTIGGSSATNRIVDHLGNRVVDHLGNFIAHV